MISIMIRVPGHHDHDDNDDHNVDEDSGLLNNHNQDKEHDNHHHNEDKESDNYEGEGEDLGRKFGHTGSLASPTQFLTIPIMMKMSTMMEMTMLVAVIVLPSFLLLARLRNDTL